MHAFGSHHICVNVLGTHVCMYVCIHTYIHMCLVHIQIHTCIHTGPLENTVKLTKLEQKVIPCIEASAANICHAWVYGRLEQALVV